MDKVAAACVAACAIRDARGWVINRAQNGFHELAINRGDQFRRYDETSALVGGQYTGWPGRVRCSWCGRRADRCA
eukprot:3536124-Pleurochrysis_carterae.AAC.2